MVISTILFWFDNFFINSIYKEIIHFIGHFGTNETELILFILTLIDLSFAGNLLIIVIFSGYENFVSKLNIANHEINQSGWELSILVDSNLN